MPIAWPIHPDVLSFNSIRQCHIDFTRELAPTELLTGTPTVVEVGTSQLAITDVSVSTVPETVDGETVAIGKAVTFTVSCATEGVYTLVVSVQTSSRPTQQVLVYEATLTVL